MRNLRWTLLAAFLVWMAFWFWAFSFAYSGSFFQYHLATRLPFLLLALLAVAVPPLSGYRSLNQVLRGKSSKPRAIFLNLGITVVPLLFFWGAFWASILIGRRAGRIAFEADEAMGIGIDFMLCAGVVVAFNIVFALVAAGMVFFDRKGTRHL